MSVADRPAFPNGLTPKPIALVSSGTFLGICFRFPLRFGNREAQVLQEPKAPLHTPPVLCFARNRQKCGWYRAKRRGNLTIKHGNAVLATEGSRTCGPVAGGQCSAGPSERCPKMVLSP